DPKTGKCVSNSSNGGNGMGLPCWILLITALVLSALACILGIIAACTLNTPLGIAAGVLGVVALALLAFWLALCAGTDCSVFNTLRHVVMVIIAITPIVALLLGIFGSPLCGILAGAILWGYWGSVLAMLDLAGPLIG